MARMGDWRNNKDEEIDLDGIGGVNILVKADVHRSGEIWPIPDGIKWLTKSRYQLPMLCFREPSRDRRICEDGETSRVQSGWSTELRCLGKSRESHPLDLHLLMMNSTSIPRRSQEMQPESASRSARHHPRIFHFARSHASAAREPPNFHDNCNRPNS